MYGMTPEIPGRRITGGGSKSMVDG
jgi:hypothetical protein